MQKFRLKFKDTLLTMGLNIMLRDKAFYYSHEDRELQGAVQTHVVPSQEETKNERCQISRNQQKLTSRTKNTIEKH